MTSGRGERGETRVVDLVMVFLLLAIFCEGVVIAVGISRL